MSGSLWEKDVWDFQARSGTISACPLILHFPGKIAVQRKSGNTLQPENIAKLIPKTLFHVTETKGGQTLFFYPFFEGVPASIALRSTDSLWLENCMISQSFGPSRGRAAKVLVQKLLRAAEAEKRGLKNRVWPHLVK